MTGEDPLIWQLLLLLLLILISGFFSCAEIAIITLNKNKVEKMSALGSRRESRLAKRILLLTSQPSKFFATIQIGSILAGFLASAFAASTITGKLTGWFVSLGTAIPAGTFANASVVIITILLSFVQMVLGELVPRRVAMKKADPLAFHISGVIEVISQIFRPLVWLLTKSTNSILLLLRINPEADAHSVTEEEIRMMIDLGNARGIIQHGEKEILHNIFEFDNKTAGEVMTHRRNVVLLRLEDSDEEWEKTISENRNSFFPVCGKNPDDIAGVLRSRDYLCLKDRRRENVMAHVKAAQLVPTTVRTNVLFRRMKKNRNHFAVVLDEYGGMMGIVTMKDLLEELVGNLDDDSSSPPEQPLIIESYEKTAEQTWIINGAVSLEKAAREFGVSLPVERYDTFAGFVFSLLGQIPEDGSQAVLEANGLKIKILEVLEHRLEKAYVTKIENGENK